MEKLKLWGLHFEEVSSSYGKSIKIDLLNSKNYQNIENKEKKFIDIFLSYINKVLMEEFTNLRFLLKNNINIITETETEKYDKISDSYYEIDTKSEYIFPVKDLNYKLNEYKKIIIEDEGYNFFENLTVRTFNENFNYKKKRNKELC